MTTKTIMGRQIRYHDLSDKDYNTLGNLSAITFLGLGLASRLLMVRGMTLLVIVFMPVSLVFFARAAAGSWNHLYEMPKEYTNATR